MAGEKMFRTSLSGYNKEDVDAFIIDLNVEMQVEKQESERIIRELKEALENAKQEKLRAEETLGEIEKELRDSKSRADYAECEVTLLKARVSTIESDVPTLEVQKSELIAKNEEVVLKNNELIKINSDLLSEKGLFVEKIDQLNDLLQTRKNTIDELSTQLKDATYENEQLNQRLAFLTENVDQKDDTVEKVSELVERCRREKEELTLIIEDLNDKLETLSSDLDEKEAKIAELLFKIENRSTEEYSSDEFEKERTALLGRIDELSEIIIAKENEIEANKKEHLHILTDFSDYKQTTQNKLLGLEDKLFILQNELSAQRVVYDEKLSMAQRELQGQAAAFAEKIRAAEHASTRYEEFNTKAIMEVASIIKDARIRADGIIGETVSNIEKSKQLINELRDTAGEASGVVNNSMAKVLNIFNLLSGSLEKAEFDLLNTKNDI